MKTVVNFTLCFLTIIVCAQAHAQDSGEFWIATFLRGSANLSDPTIDQQALARLDSLMQDENIEVTFLGAADSLQWKVLGHAVHDHISEALNDAKRLSRARSLRARYDRGHVGVTHENVAGVKVIWRKKPELKTFTSVLNSGTNGAAEVKEPVSRIKGETARIPEVPASIRSEIIIKEAVEFDWRLQAGLWTWRGAGGSLMAPSLALNILMGRWTFALQGGVAPWQRSTDLGKQSESFVYTGVKYMPSATYGISAGAFRGWRFFTDSDRWSMKATGVAVGMVLTHRFVEFNPTLTFAGVNTLRDTHPWRLGSTLNLNFNLN